MAKVKRSPRVHKFIEQVKKHIKADPEYKPLVSHIAGLSDPMVYHPLYPPGFNTREEGVERMRWTKAVRRDSKVRLFAYKELLGSIINELTLEEWATWTRFKLLMSACPFKPFLKLDDREGLNDESIAELLRVPIELWLVTKAKLERMKRIITTKDTNVIWIPTWGSTQDPRELPVSYLKNLTEKMIAGGDEAEVTFDEDEMDEIKFIKSVIEHLNERTRKHFTTRNISANRHINARRREGATLENFKHVIDVKCRQWMGTDMEMYVRPMTLFNAEKFWGYANEPMPKTVAQKEGLAGSNQNYWGNKGFSREEQKEIPNLRILYNQLLNKTLQLMGVETFDELPESFPVQDKWISDQLLERRRTNANKDSSPVEGDE